MKGSTPGARHLAESGIWLAWQRECARIGPPGSFMESVLEHWSGAQLAAFLVWRGQLPC